MSSKYTQNKRRNAYSVIKLLVTNLKDRKMHSK